MIPNPSTTIQKLVSQLSQAEKNHHRVAFLHFFQSILGSRVNVTLSDGTKAQANFQAGTPFPNKSFNLAFKNFNVVSMNGDNENSSPLLTENSLNQVLSITKVVLVQVDGVDLRGKNQGSELMTDGVIQQRNFSHLDGRELQAASAWLVSDTVTALEGEIPSTKPWNQFEANERLFKVKSTFDENLYTSKLDISRIPRDQIEKAERLAREIESQLSTNIHLREERGQLSEKDNDYDEEDLYSGVLRYTPVRTPTSTPTSTPASIPSSSTPLADKGSWRKGPPKIVTNDTSQSSGSGQGKSATSGKWRNTTVSTRGNSDSSPQLVDEVAPPPGFSIDNSPKVSTPLVTTVVSDSNLIPVVDVTPSVPVPSEASVTKVIDTSTTIQTTTHNITLLNIQDSNELTFTSEPIISSMDDDIAIKGALLPGSKLIIEPSHSVSTPITTIPASASIMSNDVTPVPEKKKTIGSNVKEFKLNAAAAEFKPLYAQPPLPSTTVASTGMIGTGIALPTNTTTLSPATQSLQQSPQLRSQQVGNQQIGNQRKRTGSHGGPHLPPFSQTGNSPISYSLYPAPMLPPDQQQYVSMPHQMMAPSGVINPDMRMQLSFQNSGNDSELGHQGQLMLNQGPSQQMDNIHNNNPQNDMNGNIPMNMMTPQYQGGQVDMSNNMQPMMIPHQVVNPYFMHQQTSPMPYMMMPGQGYPSGPTTMMGIMSPPQGVGVIPPYQGHSPIYSYGQTMQHPMNMNQTPIGMPNNQMTQQRRDNNYGGNITSPDRQHLRGQPYNNNNNNNQFNPRSESGGFRNQGARRSGSRDYTPTPSGNVTPSGSSQKGFFRGPIPSAPSQDRNVSSPDDRSNVVSPAILDMSASTEDSPDKSLQISES